MSTYRIPRPFLALLTAALLLAPLLEAHADTVRVGGRSHGYSSHYDGGTYRGSHRSPRHSRRAIRTPHNGAGLVRRGAGASRDFGIRRRDSGRRHDHFKRHSGRHGHKRYYDRGFYGSRSRHSGRHSRGR